jgi:hypothetical protein
VNEFFDHTFIKTSYCREIETLDWNSGDSRRLVRHGYSFITQKQLNDMLKKEEHTEWFKKGLDWFNSTLEKIFEPQSQKIIVRVKMLRTNWIFRGTQKKSEPNDLFQLIRTLDKEDSDQLYNTEFVAVLIEEFWDLYQSSIFLFVFLPFVIYAMCVIFYFSNYFLEHAEEKDITVGVQEKVIKVLIYFLNLYLAFFEGI